MDFAALRSVANGTKRTWREFCPVVRFRREADMRRQRVEDRSVVIDPQRT